VLKITEIRTYLVNANEGMGADRPRGRNWVFCRVLTDGGIHGVGEGGGWPAVVQVGIQEVSPLLIGEDPFDIQRLWLRVYDVLHGHGLTGAVRGGVISAIDTALWDIKGKALGVPVYQLLGGKVRDRIRL
jgi:galactonate dehydratase